MSYRDVVLRRAAPTMMSEEELQCSVCFELPLGEVHQCTRGHFLCVACWNGMDEAWGGRKCPECRVPLGRSNRCRVAELAIKNLPRPDGYTTPPLAQERPNNRGDALTPLLEGQVTRDLEQKLRTSEAKVEELERRLEEEFAARTEEARTSEARWCLKEAELERKNTQLDQKLKEAMRRVSIAEAGAEEQKRRLDMEIIENNEQWQRQWSINENQTRFNESTNRKLAKLEHQIKEDCSQLQLLKKKLEVMQGALAERSRQLKDALEQRDALIRMFRRAGDGRGRC